MNRYSEKNTRIYGLKVENVVCFGLAVVLFWFGDGGPAGSAEPSLNAVDAVLRLGPLQASVGQLQAMVEELDALERDDFYVDPIGGDRIKRSETESNEWKNHLLRHTRYRFLADGSVESTTWQITRPTDREELAYHSDVYVDWSPHGQDQPILQARVISSSGETHELQSNQIFDQAADTGRGTMFGDDRRRTAVLPGVGIDSIIEVKKVVRTRPTMDGSVGVELFLTDFEPPRVLGLSLSGDASVRWQHQFFGPELRVQESREDGSRNLS
ncbi:MAG: DUF3857 domain-containing protein, partial [Planctomycetota bacterium]